MAEADKKGTFAGVIAAAADAAAAEGSGEQLDMLMPPTRANVSVHEEERIRASIKRDRAGRPPGAKNKVTREMLEFLRNSFGDPMLWRFRYAAHTPESFAIAMNCTVLEAFDRLDKLHADLARFFYAQQAPTDAQGNAVAPRLTVVFGGQNAAQIGPNGAAQAPWLYLEKAPQPNAETQQNQALLTTDNSGSHGAGSHGEE
ncbi:hypothetical protein [Afipia felis]|uniref:Uncharacterized protein n=2 Tax=Afipia felis TaxID=1035 RepID=A0A380W5S4_AFIFE|nr:hypothetical protein [Afipia felis]EKS26507.1 hypothetical protein HMPREF9697_04033 [Afipia felis ATCC 53690]SUU76159.1 Uncharacterised protein [Afipia felis]SUU84226.1 Uncharacterised protein [Afipia felis]SUW28196.1 Uncharacterised protein [Afipia felis]